ncbi:MAG: transporter permease [Herbinix sp.]|jgi:putative ABC transport system permease protein|nr:transporter permease [Herbinix sp.]
MLMLMTSSIQLGLLYAIMAMGIYTTFRILNIPDLTVDGSFSLGMAVAAVLTMNGHPLLALIAAIIVGAAAGSVTGFLQTKVGIHPILSGILVMTGLYTVNLAVMGGKSNLSVAGKVTLFTKMEELIVSKTGNGKTLLTFISAILVLLILAIFYKTRLGLAIRATGDNEDMVRSSSINANLTKCIGLAIGNACVALSGALVSQHQMFSDVGFGSGLVVIGLASVIIGEALFGRRSVLVGLLSALVGSVAYRIIIAYALKFNIFPSFALKLVSAVIVAIALSVPTIAANMKQNKLRREAKNQ